MHFGQESHSGFIGRRLKFVEFTYYAPPDGNKIENLTYILYHGVENILSIIGKPVEDPESLTNNLCVMAP